MFGPYRLDGLVGSGGMGDVWRAFDTRKRDRPIALKLLPEQLSHDDEFRARFQREAEIVATLREPHIIPIHDYGEIGGRLYLDMRLVDGLDLAGVLERDGPLAPERATAVIEQIAAALDAAHAEGLVHRDVKPSNVLVTPGPPEFVYLVDFGIARGMRTTARGRLTSTGATVGTLEYMAPERFLGGPIDAKADVYALACVLFEVLSGRPPFVGDMPALIHAHLSVPPPSPTEHRAGLTLALNNVVARGMAKQPADRHPTAGDLAAATRSALSQDRHRARPGRGGAARTVTRRARVAAEPDRSPETTVIPPADESSSATPRRIRGSKLLAAVLVAGLVMAGIVAEAMNRSAGTASQAVPSVQPTNPFIAADPVALTTTTIRVGRGPFELVVADGGRRVYVANNYGGSLSVIDTASLAVVATIPDTLNGGTRDLLVAPDGRRVYFTSGPVPSPRVKVVDTGTNRVVRTTSTTDDEVSSAVPGSCKKSVTSPDGRYTYATTDDSTLFSVTDQRADRRVVASGPIGRGLHCVALTPDRRQAYVTDLLSDDVSVIGLGSLG